MAGETVNPVQVGPPRYLRMYHAIVNSQMWIFAQDQPLPYHFWMLHRIGIEMQANAAAAGVPPWFAVYHANVGLQESATGTIIGQSTAGAQVDQMTLMDSGFFTISGTTNLLPMIVADENHPCYVPENRVIVVNINAYTTSGAQGSVLVDIQYTDWIYHVPTTPTPSSLESSKVLTEGAASQESN